MNCNLCNAEGAHATKINDIPRWLCWDCTKKLVIEHREKKIPPTPFCEARA